MSSFRYERRHYMSSVDITCGCGMGWLHISLPKISPPYQHEEITECPSCGKKYRLKPYKLVVEEVGEADADRL